MPGDGGILEIQMPAGHQQIDARGRVGYGAMLVRLVTRLDPRALTVPTLVIAGRTDRIAPAHRSRLLAEKLPRLVDLRTRWRRCRRIFPAAAEAV